MEFTFQSNIDLISYPKTLSLLFKFATKQRWELREGDNSLLLIQKSKLGATIKISIMLHWNVEGAKLGTLVACSSIARIWRKIINIQCEKYQLST